MAFADLHEVVPWGRPFAEYVRMFALTPADLNRRIVDCGGGPASFAAEAAARGTRVVACDPLYHFSAEEIAHRIDAVVPTMVAGMEAARDRFNWTEAGSPKRHAARRLSAMRRFLADFSTGRHAGRYVTTALPALGFRDDAFDLALSSHFLFLYSDQRSITFHLAAIEEMLRVATEARMFPLLDLAGGPSRHLDPVLAEVRRRGHAARIVTVPYEFQRGGDQLLVITRAAGSR